MLPCWSQSEEGQAAEAAVVTAAVVTAASSVRCRVDVMVTSGGRRRARVVTVWRSGENGAGWLRNRAQVVQMFLRRLAKFQT